MYYNGDNRKGTSGRITYFRYVRKDYLMRRCAEMEEEKYYATEKELSERTELYLRALREYNRREVLMKRLMRRKNIENIKMGEYLKILNEMLAAKRMKKCKRYYAE